MLGPDGGPRKHAWDDYRRSSSSEEGMFRADTFWNHPQHGQQRRDDQSERKSEFFNNRLTGKQHRDNHSDAAYRYLKANRDADDPANVTIDAGTRCPQCGKALKSDRYITFKIQEQAGKHIRCSPRRHLVVHYTCPNSDDAGKRTCKVITLCDAKVRADIFSSSDALQPDQVARKEEEIVAAILHVYEQYNANGKAAAEQEGTEWQEFKLNARFVNTM